MSFFEEFGQNMDEAAKNEWESWMVYVLMPFIMLWRWYNAAKNGEANISIKKPHFPSR